MNIHLSLILRTLLLIFLLPTSIMSADIETLKELMTESASVGMASPLEKVRGFQQDEKLSDEQIRVILMNIVRNALIKNESLGADKSVRRDERVVLILVAEGALSALASYGDEHVKSLLRDVIEKCKDFRYVAVSSYMSLVNYAVTDVVTNILTETTKYDVMDRYHVYDELINHYKICNEAQKKSIVFQLDTAVSREDDICNTILLDPFLAEAQKGYANSVRRRDLLRKYVDPAKTNRAQEIIQKELSRVEKRVGK